MKIELNRDWTEFLSLLIVHHVRFDKIFMLGKKPWRIDVLTGIDGVTFEEAWKDRVEAEFATKPLFVIGRAALTKNKRAAGRAKDLADVATLESPKRAPSKRKRKHET